MSKASEVTIKSTDFKPVQGGENISTFVSDGFLYIRSDISRPRDGLKRSKTGKTLNVGTVGRPFDVGDGVKLSCSLYISDTHYDTLRARVVEFTDLDYAAASKMTLDELEAANADIGDEQQAKQASVNYRT